MKKLLMVIVVMLVVGALGGILLFGCNNASDPQNVKSIPGNPIDYGNGVYYFGYSEADFGNALSAFMKSRPDYQLVTMASDNTGGYGCTVGYFVYFKLR